MGRNGLIILLVAVIAWVLVAMVLGGGSFSGARAPVLPSGVSPACEPASLEHSARLPGASIEVSPAPGTVSANTGTQISFLGVPVTGIREVKVVGSESGVHGGHVYGYFQGDGGSFVPNRPFDAGERVGVTAVVGSGGTSRRVNFDFRTVTAYPTAQIPPFPNPPANPASVQSFVSEPGIHPPILSVRRPDGDPGAGDVLMTVGPGPGQYGPLIYTPQGRLVWFESLPGGLGAENLSVQSYEGQRDLTWWQGRVLSLGFGQGEDVVMDSNYQRVATVRGGTGEEADLHDFQIAPNNIAYITVYDVIRCDLSPLGGPKNGALVDTGVQEIDMKTGLVRWEWHSLDHVALGESHAPLPPPHPSKPTEARPWDWFHLNSIDPLPDGDVLISARSTWAMYDVYIVTGGVRWRLGGMRSSFAMGPGAEMAWQHDARMLPDGTVSVFDDGAGPQVHFQSRGVRIALDMAHHTASLVRAYTHPSALLTGSQGNMQSLPSGSVVIGWGAVPDVSEESPSGAVLFDAGLSPGLSSYRAFRFPWSGQPLSPPVASAAVLATGETTAVYASWDGASEVASWRVLAGKDPSSLAPRETIPESGFESSTILPEAVGYVAVQALDSSGRTLGTSATVAASKPPTPGTGK
jgi:hypothetical protein